MQLHLRTLALVPLFASAAAAAQAGGVALSAKFGSTGIGAEATLPLGSQLNVRLGGAAFKYNYGSQLSDVDYSLSLNLKGGSAALDFHPGGGLFRISVGALLHANRLSGAATPPDSVHIGNHRYEPSQIGELSVNASYKRHIAPFASLGVGNGARGKRVFFSMETGVAFTRAPAVTLHTSGSAPAPGLEADLHLEEQNVNDDLRILKIYPVVSFGIGLRL
jgi:hypothetical protein